MYIYIRYSAKRERVGCIIYTIIIYREYYTYSIYYIVYDI